MNCICNMKGLTLQFKCMKCGKFSAHIVDYPQNYCRVPNHRPSILQPDYCFNCKEKTIEEKLNNKITILSPSPKKKYYIKCINCENFIEKTTFDIQIQINENELCFKCTKI